MSDSHTTPEGPSVEQPEASGNPAGAFAGQSDAFADPQCLAAGAQTSRSGFSPREAIKSGVGKLTGNALVRCGIIFFITLILLVPLGFVENIVYERQYLHQEATRNITASWGEAQSISGPVLVLPYEVWQDHKKTVTVKVGKEEREKEVIERKYYMRYKLVLPAELSFDAGVEPEIRYRGIYRQALYNAPVAIQGHFVLPKTDDFASNTQKIHWDKAWLAVGITDLKTISESSPLQWAGSAAPAYKPGTGVGKLLGPGFHTDLALSDKAAGARQDFSLTLSIRGSGGIAFTPVGEKTAITVAGAWPDPSFQGNLLPVERKITDKGFSARWNISNLTRTYPQIEDVPNLESVRELESLRSFTAGVDLHETVSLYRMVRRAVHYGILFIAVSFVTLFAFEMVSRQRMHLLQYGMVGLSMSLFYLILLSLAEHIDFGLAFTAASAVTAGMNSLYVAAALQSKTRGLVMAALLSGLYALLFSLLRMEDFALLVGTGLVVAMMAVLMFVTRKLPRSEG